MTLSDLIESFQTHTPKYAHGMKIPYIPPEPLPTPRVVRTGLSPDFEPIAPLKNYVPEAKRNRMANEAKWQKYSDQLKGGLLASDTSYY